MSAPSWRVGIVTTHPIQYQVPWFQALARRPELDLTVFYALLPTPRQQGVGFDVSFTWDLPLLHGYRYELLRNVARPPGLERFGGCDTPDIGRVLDDRHFDALIVNGWHTKSGLQTLAACRRRGLPCVVRGDSNALRRRPLATRLLHRLLLRQYAAFLVVGTANADFYHGGGVPEQRLFFAPHAVDNERFGLQADTLRPERAALRAAWRIADEAVTFLFCGKLVAKKRPLDLIDALAHTRARVPLRRVHLLVVGDGELRAAAEARAAAVGIDATFAGFLNQSEIARAYVVADALVLPSDYGETWGLVVNEGMACGLPAIVSNRVGCHPDLIISGHTGRVVPFGDVRALGAALGEVAQDRGRAAAWGAAARAHVQRYSVDALVSGTLDALRYAVSYAQRQRAA